jgi:hypothetical protein
MAQSTSRRRGSRSCPARHDRANSSPVDSGRPRASALAASALLVSLLGLLAAGVAGSGSTAAIPPWYAANVTADQPAIAAKPGVLLGIGFSRASANIGRLENGPARSDDHPGRFTSNAGRSDRTGRPADDLRVETVRQDRLAHSLIFASAGALAIAGSGLLLVGVRRRLW